MKLPILDEITGTVFGRLVQDDIEYWLVMVPRDMKKVAELPEEQRRITGPCYPALVKVELPQGGKCPGST